MLARLTATALAIQALLTHLLKTHASSASSLVSSALNELLIANCSFQLDATTKLGPVHEGNAAVGDRVTRGPYWNHANQDGERGL
jgi:hypothetical protein